MKDELYYEKYDNVAIMFATIKNYDMEQVGLSVLNRIICDFDEVVSFANQLYDIKMLNNENTKFGSSCLIRALSKSKRLK